MTSALMIIDTWDQYHPGYTHLNTPMERTISRICQLLYKWPGPVVLAAYQTYLPKPESDRYPWKEPHHAVLNSVKHGCDNYIISYDTNEVKEFLDQNNVSTLHYAGFSIPGCIEFRPLGIKNMQDKYNCRIVIDCVLDLYDMMSLEEATRIHNTYKYVLSNNYSYDFMEYLPWTN